MEKQPLTSPPWGVATKSIVAIVSLILVSLVIWRFQSLIAPITLAVILAYLLHPVIRFVESATTLSRGTSVLLVYLVLMALVAGGSLALGIAAATQVEQLSTQLPGLVSRSITLVETVPGLIPRQPFAIGSFQVVPDDLIGSFDWGALATQAAGLIEPAFNRSGSFVALLAQTTVNVLGLVILIFVVSIYIAQDLPRIGNAISDLAHQPGYRQDADRLVNDFVRIWNSYLRGQVILGIVIWIIVSAVLTVLGVSNALALGLLSGLLEFLPIVGPVIGTTAAVLVAIFQPENYLGFSAFNFGLIVLIVMITIQSLENNILVPRIVGDALDLHPLAVMISVLMGSSLAGILGAVLAAPVVASIKLLGTYAWRKMLDLPPFPDPIPTHVSVEQTSHRQARVVEFRENVLVIFSKVWHKIRVLLSKTIEHTKK